MIDILVGDQFEVVDCNGKIEALITVTEVDKYETIIHYDIQWVKTSIHYDDDSKGLYHFDKHIDYFNMNLNKDSGHRWQRVSRNISFELPDSLFSIG